MPATSRAERRRTREHPLARVRLAERQYASKLMKIARHVDDLVRGHDVREDLAASVRLTTLLRSYSMILEPWARAVSGRMVEEIESRDRAAWRELSAEMSPLMRREIQEAPTGEALRRFLDENVTLITSLPLDAAERVHKLAVEGLSATAARRDEIARDILATGEVTRSRARLIARTEIARTASGLTQARAEWVGSEAYVWRTAGDADVRRSHAEMRGRVVRWDAPPTLSDGTTTHAGQIYNCRCWPDPILPDVD